MLKAAEDEMRLRRVKPLFWVLMALRPILPQARRS